jgi:hypothetical protein
VSKKNIVKVAGFIGTLGAGAALVATAATGTGAYFTDTQAGSISGTMGTIQIQAGDGGPAATTINFTKMLPGEAQAKTVQFKNTGQNPQDVWIVFDQSHLGDHDHNTDTGAVNDRGTYAEIHIKSGSTAVFDSANLNDDSNSCPPGVGNPACNPLPPMIKLRSNLAPGASGNFTFSYMPAAKYKNNQGAPEVSLPYQLVATQHGISPDNSLNNPITFP